MAALLDADDPKFPEALIIGGRYGGRVLTSSITMDPLMPDTLEVYFDDWNLSARASLFLQYGRLKTASGERQRFAGIPDEDRRRLEAYYADERGRIAQVIESGGYDTAWRPFIARFLDFIREAERRLPPGDTTGEGTLSAYQAIGRLARQKGLYELVRQLPVDPSDVANEMLRLLAEARRNMGAPGDAAETDSSLLYSCVSISRSVVSTQSRSTASARGATRPKRALTVHVHTWHSLAPAFIRAWTAADKNLNDSQAKLIVEIFDGLTSEINSWAEAHPDADSTAVDRALNQVAANHGLIALLHEYGTTSKANPNTPAEHALSR